MLRALLGVPRGGSGGSFSTQNFSTSGSYTIPATGCNSMVVKIWGGGGGGGGARNSSYTGAAGGPGDYVSTTLTVAAGDIMNIYVGGGGGGGTSGAGGAGGAGGTTTGNGAGGAGGAGVTTGGGGGGGGAASIISNGAIAVAIAGGGGGGGGGVINYGSNPNTGGTAPAGLGGNSPVGRNQADNSSCGGITGSAHSGLTGGAGAAGNSTCGSVGGGGGGGGGGGNAGGDGARSGNNYADFAFGGNAGSSLIAGGSSGSDATHGAAGAGGATGNGADGTAGYVTLQSCSIDCSTGTAPIGTLCSDGTYYAGTVTINGNTIKLATTPGGCGYEASGASNTAPSSDFTPTCSGTDTMMKQPNLPGSNPAGMDIVVAGDVRNASTVSGDPSTAGIVAASSTAYAAKYCYHLSFGGKTDWYLPSKTEMHALICRGNTSGVTASGANSNEDNNCTSFGYGTASHSVPGIQTVTYGAYVTSSGHSWAQAPIFEQIANGTYTGTQTQLTNTTAALVRCIRRIP